MRSRLCGVFFLLTFLTALWCIGGEAAELQHCALTVDGMHTEAIRPGIASAELTIVSDERTDAWLLGAVYAGHRLYAVRTQPQTLEAGEQTLRLSNLEIGEGCTELRFMLWERDTLKPIAQPMRVFASELPRIETLTLSPGEKTYAGMIDETNKTIDVNVPIYYSANGVLVEIGSRPAYQGTLKPDAFETAVKALTPEITCAAGAVVVGGAGQLDLSVPQTVTVQNASGQTCDYTLRVSPVVMQRDVNFRDRTLILNTPFTQYGRNDSTRHNAPNNGVLAGSGVWRMENFSYQTNQDGAYIDASGAVISESDTDAESRLVRTAETPGYNEIVSGQGLRMVKDRTGTGDFALYSYESSTPGFGVKRTVHKAEFTIEALSGDGFALCFGAKRFVLRAVPNADGSTCRLDFGLEGALKNTGVDAALGESLRISCLVEETDSGTRGSLYLGERQIATVDAVPEDANRLDIYHGRFCISDQATARILLSEWSMAYQTSEAPEAMRALYEAVQEEEKEIYLWMATLYDGAASAAEGNGFFYAPSSKANPELFQAEIESSGQMLGNMNATGLLPYMPTEIRDRFLTFFENRYQSEENFYYDPMYRPYINDRQKSRNLSYATQALGQLRAETTSSQAVSAAVAAEPSGLAAEEAASLALAADTETLDAGENIVDTEAALPAEYESPAAFRAWIEQLPWATHAWTAGDKLSNAPTYINRLPQAWQAEYWHEALDFLLTTQNENGTWGGKTVDDYGVLISGVFKVDSFLKKVPKEILAADSSWIAAGLDTVRWIPRAQQIYNYIAENLMDSDVVYSNTLMIRNTLDVLYDIFPMINGKLMERDLPRMLSYCFEKLRMYELADSPGEYVSSIDANGRMFSGVSTGMGYDQSLGLSEGCINTATSITKLYLMLQKAYGLQRPKFDREFAAQFFGILTDELEHQTYAEIDTQRYHHTITQDFESQTLNQPPTVTAPETYQLTNPSFAAQVRGTSGAQYLEFTYDGTASTGPGLAFGNRNKPTIRTGGGEVVTLGFRMRVQAAADCGNGFYTYFGLSNAALFALKKNGNTFQTVTRTSTSQHGSENLKTLQPNTWYDVKLVYRAYATGDMKKLSLYLGDQTTPVYETDTLYGGNSNVKQVGTAVFQFFKNAKGVMDVDNVSLCVTRDKEPIYITEMPTPTIERLSVRLGERTYEGMIDQESKTIELNVPLYWVNNNTNIDEIAVNGASAYEGTPDAAAYQQQLRAVTPELVCSEHTSVISDAENLDLTRPQTIWVGNANGETVSYQLSAQAMTLQREVDFSKTTRLVTPDTTTYNAGANPLRHNAPLNGVVLGSGIFCMENFAYQEQKQNGDYVRDEDTPGENCIVSGRGIRMTKDRDGTFGIYSLENHSPQARVGKTVTELRLTVEALSGDGLQIDLGRNRYALRILPSGQDGRYRLWLGMQDDSRDTGCEIAQGRSYNLTCVVEEFANRTTRAALYVDGDWVYTMEQTPRGLYDLRQFHTCIWFAQNTRGEILLEHWSMSYALVPVDEGTLCPVVAVTASEDDGNSAENVLDRDYDTRWSAEADGASITLELDKVHSVAYLGLATYQGDTHRTTLSVQVSEDGVHYQEVVTRWQSSLTLDMEPIDLGGVYSAKYIRILGCGDTEADRNSYTEISVYEPYEGGGMPVATDGPTGITQFDALTKEQAQSLQEFDKLFERVYPWLANLYDHENGGFYMAMSGKDDPTQEPGLEMTFYALSCIMNYSDCWGDLPETVKQRLIQFILDRQDPETGMFIDKQGPVNDRETARNQACVMGWVKRWNVELPYRHPSQIEKQTPALAAADAEPHSLSAADSQQAVSLAADVSDSQQVMPDYLQSVDSYIAWVESWDWDKNSWTAGDQTQQSLNYLSYLDAETRAVYQDALVQWLKNRQFADNGLWAPTIDFNSISGAFKVGLIYANLGMRIPNARKTMESTIHCMKTEVPTVAHWVRNPLSLLIQISEYGPNYAAYIQQAIAENMDAIIGWMNIFLCPDGGFSMRYKQSMSNFGGIYGSHQLWEGDVDSTLMLLIARQSVYRLIGASAPPLHAPDDFWSWIEGGKATPSPYLDPKYELTEDYRREPLALDFEDAASDTVLDGTEYGGNRIDSLLSANITTDADAARDRVLALSYRGNTTQSSGPSMALRMSDDISEVRYIPEIGKRKVVLEFDIKTESCAASNNFYLSFGSKPSYALNFGGSGVQKLGVRIDHSNVNYQGTFATMSAETWHNIKLEQELGEQPEDFTCRIYLDGTPVSENKYYYNCLSGGVPSSGYGVMQICWYKAGRGTVYLDNIKHSEE